MKIRLIREDRSMHAGGTVIYRAYVGDRWVGWVGNGRGWTGSDFHKTFRWWACHREEGDKMARQSSDGLAFRTRKLAVEELEGWLDRPYAI